MLTPEPKAVYRNTPESKKRFPTISVLTPEPKAVYPLNTARLILPFCISVLTPEPKAVYHAGVVVAVGGTDDFSAHP